MLFTSHAIQYHGVKTEMLQRPGKYVPWMTQVPGLKIGSLSMRDIIQHMKDHALVGKFVRMLPPEKAFIWWINFTWKPEGNYDLQLGSKGFFMVIFISLED